MKIAILDNNRSFASVIKEILVFKGNNVKIFRNESDILNDKLLTQFDMIIIDLNLPNQYGLSIIRELKEKNVCSSVIVISVDFPDVVLRELRNMGIHNFLKKPFNFKDLNKIMNSYEKVENLIDEFINKQRDKKNILLLMDGGNYKILHNLRHFSFNEFEEKIKEIDLSETYIIDKMVFSDLPFFLSQMNQRGEKIILPKVIIILKEDLIKLNKLFSEKPDAKELVIKNTFVIDLKYIMS